MLYYTVEVLKEPGNTRSTGLAKIQHNHKGVPQNFLHDNKGFWDSLFLPFVAKPEALYETREAIQVS